MVMSIDSVAMESDFQIIGLIMQIYVHVSLATQGKPLVHRFVYLLRLQVRLIAAPAGCSLLQEGQPAHSSARATSCTPSPPIRLKWQTTASGSRDRPNLWTQQLHSNSIFS
ncbi:hypothetical protein UY3_11877 [Chelonia mydas]|uniref:Uncharacterized protein n=1 Tax=Chelonia mydas TaxID=8469 RepID=M7B1P4_CHEMY|nr:hypothetical protein UY3_11877 [Chelonia mydas]